MAFATALDIWGLIVSGDIGDLTIYTDRFGRKTAYPISYPNKPPSPLQIIQRNRFRDAQAQWSTLTTAQRAAYELAVNRASLCMTGQNLYISIALKASWGTLETIAKQTGVSLVPPTPV